MPIWYKLYIAVDRNISFLFDKMDSTKFSHRDVLTFGTLQAISTVELDEHTITLCTESKDPVIQNKVMLLCKKVENTLRYCRMVVDARTKFVITQQDVRLSRMDSCLRTQRLLFCAFCLISKVGTNCITKYNLTKCCQLALNALSFLCG